MMTRMTDLGWIPRSDPKLVGVDTTHGLAGRLQTAVCFVHVSTNIGIKIPTQRSSSSRAIELQEESKMWTVGGKSKNSSAANVNFSRHHPDFSIHTRHHQTHKI